MKDTKETKPTESKELAPATKALAPLFWSSPFAFMNRLTREMDRIFEDFGFGRFRQTLWREPEAAPALWSPDIELFERDGQLVLRADLPGVNTNDVKVDVSEDAITVQGERKTEKEEKREGVYRTERSYGSFYRCVPLPEGAIVDEAKATFKNGVLEVVVPAPPEEARRGRRLEIKEA